MTHFTFKEALWSVFRPVWRPLPAPGPEGCLARLAFAAMALTMMWGLRFQFDSQDVPTGLAHFVDLTFLSKPGVMAWVTGVFAVLCVPYVFAQGLAVVLPLPLVGVPTMEAWTSVPSELRSTLRARPVGKPVTSQ